ncbi:MAG: RluA family pseudouridine synthase [Candidatus Gracilibacteria bacterium]|nr:RluA family pseudouridine synthase [Candidatus Gracilibacteria bacterium]
MKEIKIQENDASQRLDKFLKKLFVNASLSLIYKLNRKNKIKINGKVVDNSYKLEKDDIIKIFISDEEYGTLSKKNELVQIEISSKLDKKDILYEDKNLLIINKNPGINVHPGDHKTKEVSLIEQVQDYLGNQLNSLTFKPSLVHRIDRDTSGTVLIAKNKLSLDFLTKELREHKIDKYYLAICFGIPDKSEGTIKAKLERIENANKEDKVQVSEKGQEAITKYKVLETFKKEDLEFSVIECKIETGRMHQIRVHLAHIGYPIVGDDKYGDKKINSHLKRKFGISRQLLHAQILSFTHPVKKIKVTHKARLKEDMERFLDSKD